MTNKLAFQGLSHPRSFSKNIIFILFWGLLTVPNWLQAGTVVSQTAELGNIYIDPEVTGPLGTGSGQNSQSAFHLVSHGKPGLLYLENKWRGPAEIAEWLKAHHFPAHKNHLNIYGCNFAQGKKGHAAVEYLEAALGVTIAASDDVTGIGGDWDLEVGTPLGKLSWLTYQGNLQGYIDCATILSEGNYPSVSVGGHTIVENGLVYTSFDLYQDATDQRLPVINGTDFNSSNGYGHADVYFAIFDEHCNQLLGTYFGGSDLETLEGMYLDTEGNVVFTGFTTSDDFPTTDGTSDNTTFRKAYLRKYAPDGTIIFSTILGGIDGGDRSTGLTIEGTDIYIFGEVFSSNFPTTNGATISGGADAFAVKYDGDGNLLYSTIYGGSQNDLYNDAVIINGELHLIGETDSPDFPTTDGTGTGGVSSDFMMKLDQFGDTVFSTILGGAASTIQMYSDGNDIYIGGVTYNTELSTTDGSVHAGGGERDIFIFKYDLSGNVVFSKLIGSPFAESFADMTVVNGELYLLGGAFEGPPVVNGKPNAGGRDVLLMKLDAAGNVLYSTYYGGSDNETPYYLSVNAAEEVFVMTNASFGIPVTDDTGGNSGDALLKFNTDGSLCMASIPGVGAIDESNITYDVEDNTFWLVATVYAGSNAKSTDGTQAETVNATPDAFILKFVFCPDPTPITSDLLSPNNQTVCQNGLVDQIIGEKQVIDGMSFPPIYIDGVLGNQADVELQYQWQVSASPTGPWTDIDTPLGKQKNYSPAPTTVDVYYRRQTKTSACCGGTILSTSDVASILVTGDTAPTVDAGGTFYTCPASPITIGVSPAATGGTPAYGYSWNEGVFTTETPAVAPSESTVYTLLVTDANGCIQADQATVVVYSADAGGDDSVCDGDGTNIGGRPLPGVTIVAAGDTPPSNEYSIAYDWTPKDGTLSCTDCPNPIATPGTDTDYTLTVTLNYPDGTSCQTTDIVNVSIIAAPPSAIPQSDVVICLGEEVVLGSDLAPIAAPAIVALTQTSGTGNAARTATVSNLADGNFGTGGHTNDGLNENITVDLGSVQTINLIQVAALLGRTNDDALQVEISTDNINFTSVGDSYFTGLIATSLTDINFPAQEVRYIRLRPVFSFRDVSISEVYAIYDYTYIWTPGAYIITDGANATFDAGNLEMPDVNPITYTLSTTLGVCNFYEQVTVAVIEARADEDYCGPRTVGEPDRTPNINETYTWTKITDVGITTGTGDFLGVTNEDIVPVSASVGGNVGYELTTTYTMNGVTAICRDTVIVPPTCGPGCDIATSDGGCPSFDNGTPTLVGIPPTGDIEDWTYSWTSNEGMVGLDSYTNRIVNLTDNVSRTYTITFTSILDPSFTCTDVIDVNSASFSTPVFNAISPVETCSGIPVNIGNPASNPGLSYAWSNGASLNDATISYPEATIYTNTEFTVTVTDIVTGCFVVDTVQVDVESVASAGADFTVCDNGIITLGNNADLTGYTYAWEPTSADWRNGTDQNDATPDAFVATTQEFSLTVTSTVGCVSRDTVLVTVEDLPPSISLPDLDFCPSQGTGLVLGTDDGTAGGTNLIPNGYFYSWNPTNVSDFTIQNPTVNTPLPTNSVTYEIEVRAAGGCNQKATQTINPRLSQPLASPDATICLGESISIGDDTNETTGGITYSWVPITDLNDATAINPIYNSSAAGTVTFTVTKSDGSCSAAAEVTITTVDFTAPILTPQMICEGSSVQIGTTNDNTLSYQWTPATDLDNVFISNPTFSGTSSTNYTLTVINENGCTAEATTSVTVNPPPAFTASLPDVIVCDPTATSLVINAGVNPAGSYAYNWSPSTYLDNPNVLNPTFFIPAAGTYEYVLEVIDQGTGCSVFDSGTVSTEVGGCPEICDNGIDDNGDGLVDEEDPLCSCYSPLTNLALGQITTQSSTRFGGVPERAVDGNTSGDWGNGSITHTNNEAQPWWEVDLGGIKEVKNIRLWNRTNCCSNRLSNFYVFVSDVPFTSIDPAVTVDQAGVWSEFTADYPLSDHVVSPYTTGRYVRVQLNGTGVLSIAEVEVVGCSPPEICDNGLDDDGDGLVDCDDPDCQAVGMPQLVDDVFQTCPGTGDYGNLVSVNDGNLQNPVFSIVIPPVQGTLTINDFGAFSYTPANNGCGSASFTYQVCNQPTGCCATANAVINFGDNDAPVLQNVPADLTISCDDEVPQPPVVTATDLCPFITIEVEDTDDMGANGTCGNYTITRTWTTTDICGNSASQSQLITVTDQTEPELFRVHVLPNGNKLVAGNAPHTTHLWKYVKFPILFDAPPLVFAQVTSNNDGAAVAVQTRYISTAGFEVRLREEEAADQFHGGETVSWMAVEPGILDGSTKLVAELLNNVGHNDEQLSYPTAFSSEPVFIATMNGTAEADPVTVRTRSQTANGVQVSLQEEQSLDSETDHTGENLAWLAVSNSLDIYDENGGFVVENGIVTVGHLWVTVALNHRYTKPVVLFGGLSTNGVQASTVRVRNVTPTSFEVRVQEWDYLDGNHAFEQLGYLVVEGGIPTDNEFYCFNENPLEPGVDIIAIDNCDGQVAFGQTKSENMLNTGLQTINSWMAIDDCGNVNLYTRFDTCLVAAVRLKALLDGALLHTGTSSLMRGDLREKQLIPTIEPYSGLSGFEHQGRGGAETIGQNVLDTEGGTALTDWLFVELRSQSDDAQVLSTQSALLCRDGSVTNTNGDDVLYFWDLPQDNYFVTVRHRNHLGLMTEDVWHLCSEDPPIVDLMDAYTPVLGGTTAGKLTGGRRSLWAGNFNGDGQIIYQGPYNDVFFLFSKVLSEPGNVDNLANFISQGYNQEDYDLDGRTIFQGPGNDRAMVLYHAVLSHGGNTALLANFIVVEALP